EKRVAGRAGPVDDAVDLAALSGDNWYDESLVADGDNLLLKHALLPVCAEEALERIGDRFLLLLDFPAHAGERDAGVIGDRAVGQDLAGDILEDRPKFADPDAPASEPWKAFGDGGEDRLDIGGAIEQGDQVEDLFRL